MLLPTRRRSVTGLAQHVPAPFAPSKLPMSPSCARRTDGDNETGDSGDRRGRPNLRKDRRHPRSRIDLLKFAPQWASAIDGGGAVSVLAGVHVGCFERGRDHPDGRPDGQRRRQRFDLARSDAEPAAALARPRLAHEFGQTIHPWFGMIVDRFGNSQDKGAEPRYPALTAPARPRNRAREKGDNQLHRARVLEVRIHLPPPESLRTFGS
jgi:hypothetical protein